MRTVKISHGEVLQGAKFLQMGSSDDGLVAAKLSRIRKTIADIKQASADGFDVVAKQFAKLDENGKPVVKMSEGSPAVAAANGQPAKPEVKAEEQYYQLSGTKAYVLKDDEKETQTALDKATDAYLKEMTEVSVPELTAADMSKISCPGPGGQKMAIPPVLADALLPFAPEM
jgi:hypothetical protein